MTTRQERIEKLRARLGLLEQTDEKDDGHARAMRQRTARKLTRKIDREALGLAVDGEAGS